MNSRNARMFFVVGIVLALIYLPIASRTAPENSVLVKVGSVFFLIFAATMTREAPRLLLFALAFGALGDFFLGVTRLGRLDEATLFMCGLVAFLVGHVFYIALFMRNRVCAIGERKAASWVIPIAMVVVLVMIKPHVGPLLVPVMIYASALAVMGISAQFSRFPDLTAKGAMLFVASDAMLALSRFGHPFRGANVLVWLSYYAAQAMIAWGVLSAGATSDQQQASGGRGAAVR